MKTVSITPIRHTAAGEAGPGPARPAAFVPVKVEEPVAAAPSLPAPRTAPAARRRTGAVDIALAMAAP
ncbi:MAG: hypothetical protein ACLPWS_21925 [Rhodomicrobium sp.]